MKNIKKGNKADFKVIKFIKKVSLRMRVTLLSGAILIFCAAILTVVASYNANLRFYSLVDSGEVNGGQFEVSEFQGIDFGTIEIANDAVTSITPVSGVLKAARNQFDFLNISVLFIVCVIGMALVYFVAGKSLEPIRKLSKKVSSITENDLHQRIAEEGRKDEVETLGKSFNTMLDRLELSFLRQKRFSADVAHELKTPLATMSAVIQVLNMEIQPSETDYKKAIETTEKNVKRLTDIVDNLMLLYGSCEDFEINTIDLSEMFDTIFTELKPLFDEKQLEVSFDCEMKSLRGNQSLIYRAFFNLVENAAKYNRENGKITIFAKSEKGIGIISFTDTGCGILQEDIPKIFEPFFRVNKSRSRKTGGAGLGLAIVSAIIEKHGWEIDVESVVGVGTKFIIKTSI